MTQDSQPPEWATAYFQDCRDLLGIGADWHLWLTVADTPGDNEDADGYCELEVPYLKATVIIRRGLSEERTRYVIMHELLHVALAPIDLAVDRLHDFISSKLHMHTRILFSNAEEQTIERLTRALQRSVKPKQEA